MAFAIMREPCIALAGFMRQGRLGIITAHLRRRWFALHLCKPLKRSLVAVLLRDYNSTLMMSQVSRISSAEAARYPRLPLIRVRSDCVPDSVGSQVKLLFERAIKASPSDALTRADYGRFLAQVDHDIPGAMEHLREAMRCDPDW